RNCINLTSLDFSNNLNLISIFCNDNSLTSLNITNNIALQGLYCVRNQLTTLDVSNNIYLSTLACALNLLESLDVSQNINLTQLFCYNNQLTTLDIYANPALLIVSCSNNLLSNLTITNAPQLIRIHCSNNQLTSLDLSNFPLLKHVFCDNNLLTSLDFSVNPHFNILYCINNPNLTTLNLNNNPLLERLHCNDNNLSSVLLQNGSNTLLNGQYVTNPGSETLIYDARFKATNNPNLSCIFVDDVANCNANWLEKDATSHYVSTQQECEAILQNDEFTTSLFTLYPNPVHNMLYVENNTNTTIQKIVVYDVTGKTIMEQRGNIAQIDFSNFTRGLYFVKISSEKEIKVKKIMRR
ncbi:T9SS type A sorting domain-containing protein, partial [Flavobacterium sp.]|uniref:T9SS type A sorting domain-containing protein n=1 Tax=Flavobacterium sp. TaxID=239 RepID=UPI0039E67CB7